jgi:type VI secretion system secreted protein VgrG
MREPLLIFGTVMDTEDPDGLNRLQVELKGFGESTLTLPWLRLIQPTALADSGHVWLPEVDSEVVILRGAGNEASGMVVLGALYNGANKPLTAADGDNYIKQIHTKGGHDITIDDTSGSEKITVTASGEKLIIEMDVEAGTISVTADKFIELTCEGETIVMDAEGKKIAIESADTVEIKAANEVNIEGTSAVNVKGTDVAVTGDASVTIESAQIDVKASAAATVEGSATLTLKGGMVSIN